MIDDTWWELREIRFTRAQIPWLLTYLEILRNGAWPSAKIASRSMQQHSDGYFVPLSLLVAEIETRLELCGSDGGIAELYYTYRKSESDIARIFNCKASEIIPRIENVIRYMAGWRRKRRTYREWLQHKRGQNSSPSIK